MNKFRVMLIASVFLFFQTACTISSLFGGDPDQASSIASAPAEERVKPQAIAKPTTFDGSTATITATSLYVRSGPSMSDEATDVLHEGDTVSVIGDCEKEEDKWCFISYFKNENVPLSGWVYSKYLEVNKQ
jgi:uncharacterized protein YgiM (DUF1202 family)